jgi:hypothetical protein
MLVDRVATWNTNADPSAWLQLAGRMTFCEFESGEGDSTTRIAVDLVTLYSEQPTLAAIAYLSKIPPALPEVPSHYATGVVRGADLAPILRYQPGDKLPAMYEEQGRR